MFRGQKVLAVIPARSGSKRLPNKNIKDFHGKPLIAWSIQAGLDSSHVDQVLVSTDDERIRSIAVDWGASAPFLRPVELAKDESTTYEVLVHALREVNSTGSEYSYLALLQPTSPLRTGVHVDAAFECMQSRGAVGVISLCHAEHPPAWTNTLPPDGSLEHFLQHENSAMRSQDFAQYFRLNGAIYIAHTDKFVEQGGFFLKSGVTSYIMPRLCSIDIDTPDDFKIAECLHRIINQNDRVLNSNS